MANSLPVWWWVWHPKHSFSKRARNYSLWRGIASDEVHTHLLSLSPEQLLLQSCQPLMGAQTFCLSGSPDHLFMVFCFTFIIHVIFCRNILKFILIHPEVIIIKILANVLPDNYIHPYNTSVCSRIKFYMLFYSLTIKHKHLPMWINITFCIIALNGYSSQFIDVPTIIEPILYCWIFNLFYVICYYIFCGKPPIHWVLPINPNILSERIFRSESVG